MSFAPGLLHWLILSTLLFSIGLYGVLARRSAIGVLISIELMLNSTGINFVLFNHYIAPRALDGALFVIFIIAVAAAEAVVAMAIFVAIFRSHKTVELTKISTMKG
ncbi:MAG: NADH-quinone oxidoreductase subunit NuoK [candidate division Zixibacteria bacterium]